jgi:ATP adenylyltransferase
MERLYTPWRRAFIEGTKDSGCFLCAAASAEPSDDREHLVLLRAERAFVLLNLYPYNNGHVMVAPYEHTDGRWTVTAAN